MPTTRTHSFVATPYQADYEKIQQQRRFSEALRAEGVSGPAPSGKMVGELFSPTSPLVGINKILQALLGGVGVGQADKDVTALSTRATDERSQALAQALQQAQGSPEISNQMGPGRPEIPGDPTGAAYQLMGSPDPYVQSQGLPLLGITAAQQTRQAQTQAQQQAQQEALAQRNQQAEAQRQFQSQQAESQRGFQAQQATQAQQSREDLARLTAQLRPNPAEQNKPPSGYRLTQSGNLEAIPGGPADTKLQGQLNQDTAALQQAESGLDRLSVAANALKSHPGLSRITGIMGALPNVPGGAAADAEAALHTLKAQTGFAVLQDMRNASKTGGALGQITERELAFLQNALAALDKPQSKEAMAKSLQDIIKFTEESKGRLRNAYNMKHQGGGTPAQPQGGGLTPEEQAELEQLRKRFGR